MLKRHSQINDIHECNATTASGGQTISQFCQGIRWKKGFATRVKLKSTRLTQMNKWKAIFGSQQGSAYKQVYNI